MKYKSDLFLAQSSRMQHDFKFRYMHAIYMLLSFE